LSAMQLGRVGLARILVAAALACGLFFIFPFGQRTLSADPFDDFRLKLALKTAFSLDPYLRVLPITITVEEGVITVSGRVDFPMQKRLAMRKIGEIADSSNVDDRLGIGLGGPDERSIERVDANALKDAKLALAVRRKLKEGSGITLRDLRVAASDGAVTLDGKVNTPADKGKAGLLAGEVDGVVRVTNNLRLPGQEPSSRREVLPDRSWKGRLHDTATAVRARRVLTRDSELAPYRIRVEVRDGIVTLKGEVPDEDMVILAEQLINDLTGIAGVVNQLRVTE
jgi:osmotically-inducible protein OsmY